MICWKKEWFISRISSKYDRNNFCHVCHYFLETLIPFNSLANLSDTEETGGSNAKTRGEGNEQTIRQTIRPSCEGTSWRNVKHCDECSRCFTIEIEIESTNKTKAPEEVLKGDLIEQVVVDAVLGLVQQPSLLGDEVSDEKSIDKALAEHYFHTFKLYVH